MNNSILKYFSFQDKSSTKSFSQNQQQTSQLTNIESFGKRTKQQQKKIQIKQSDNESEDEIDFKIFKKSKNIENIIQNEKPKSKQQKKNNNDKSKAIHLKLRQQKQNKKQQGLQQTTPIWALPENIKDSQQRPIKDENYDCTTLYIPPDGLNQLTPAKRQYWICKSKNFDKIILFKLGKFYELFEEDAVIGVKYLNLNFMGNRKRAGFPEQVLDKYVKKLVEFGFKVAIVEQIETEKQMQKRLSLKKAPKHERILKRDFIAIHTKGTFQNIDYLDENPNLSYIWSIFENKNFLCIIISNFQTNNSYIELLSVDHWEHLHQMKLYLQKYPPSEVIFQKNNISQIIIEIFQNLSCDPQITKFQQDKNNYDLDQVIQLIQRCKEPQLISNFKQKLLSLNVEQRNICIQNYYMFFKYLNSLLILDQGLVKFTVEFMSNKKNEGNMYLDSQAIHHLEILETNQGEYKNSLLWLVDQCETNMGKRLLRKWISSPLYNKQKIIERQNAIIELENHKEIRNKFHDSIKKIRDLKKLYHFLNKYSLQPKVRVVFFEDVSTRKIKQLYEFFDHIQMAEKAVFAFKNYGTFNSQLIQSLIENIPEVSEIIDNIKSLISWENKKPIPHENFNQEYEENQIKIEVIKNEIDQYVDSIRERFGCKDIYLTKGKNRFELEFPDKIFKTQVRDQEFLFSSKRQKKEKYFTEYLKEKIYDLELIEERQKIITYNFINFIFEQFVSQSAQWNKFIQIIAELDALCSLSKVSFQEFIQLCKPIINTDKISYLNCQNLRHPVLNHINGEFVGNDIKLDDQQKIIILTGPNMGGKSTIMRTICTNIILAQIGCFVYADNFEFSLVDKIFTRIGASDKLEEHKSTFYIEMEETLAILKNATSNSLAVIDELGRGTSTFDGYSIATSTLNYISKYINCQVFFATHYFFIQGDLNQYANQITYKKMSYEIINDKEERLLFLYKMQDGICERSFAFNVAYLSGLPKQIIEKGQQYTSYYREHLNI